ncbi:MAG: hypothetical protein IIA87_02175 [Nanoarchaeota archaeon]|nr:hypothetical protein [Nanoarchaeota archaeon]
MVRKSVQKKVKKRLFRKTKGERKIEKELLWIVGFIAFLVIIFLVASSIFKGFNQIEYEGLIFTKERLGEIPVYHYSYYFENKGVIIKYNLYLRNDPRTLDVPVEGKDIIFDRGKRVYISVNASGLQQCPYSVLAVADLASFLSDNQFNVKGGDPGFFEAGAKRQEWVTCENKPGNVVILIVEGKETKITINNNCYEITVANCEILEATEKFRVQSIIDAKKFEE